MKARLLRLRRSRISLCRAQDRGSRTVCPRLPQRVRSPLHYRGMTALCRASAQRERNSSRFERASDPLQILDQVALLRIAEVQLEVRIVVVQPSSNVAKRLSSCSLIVHCSLISSRRAVRNHKLQCARATSFSPKDIVVPDMQSHPLQCRAWLTGRRVQRANRGRSLHHQTLMRVQMIYKTNSKT